MTTKHAPVKIALGSDFLSAFSRLPQSQQKKTRDFCKRFTSSPTNPGCNYETIKTARDPNLRSVRIDQAYRGIVLKPEQGNVYVLLWIDKHDDAYAWASKHVCKIHPETGALQVLFVEESTVQTDSEKAETPQATDESKPSGLFNAFEDSTLISLGIPSTALPAIRRVIEESELDQLTHTLPEEASDALYALAAGFSVEEVKEELARPTQVDEKDFAKAIELPDSQRRFVEISDAVEMEKVLAAPLEKWRVFLHPSQRKLKEINARGPVRVTGGAGTGKTVVAIHRAKWLATKVCQADEMILFTTFTKNLAADIQANLKEICTTSELERIEVINLDAWVSRFLGKRDYQYRVDYLGNDWRLHWDHACQHVPSGVELSPEYLRAEWEHVVQAQGIETETDYLKATRTGRRHRLSRLDRKKIWPVFEEYRALMTESGLRESIDAIRDARRIIEQERVSLPYRCVVVDEAQDFSGEAYSLIRAIIPETEPAKGNDIFIVGDAHQRIYGHRVVLSHFGIKIRGRSRKLRINYRTSEETRAWASAVLRGIDFDDLDGGKDDLKGYRSLFRGTKPIITSFPNQEAEIEAIVKHIKTILDDDTETPEGICLVSPTHNLISQYQEALQQNDYSTYLLAAGEFDDLSKNGIRMATMHRVKGVEFNHVIIAGLSKTRLPLAKNDSGKEIEEEEIESNRCLLHVAATRSRGTVWVSAHTELPKLLV